MLIKCFLDIIALFLLNHNVYFIESQWKSYKLVIKNHEGSQGQQNNNHNPDWKVGWSPVKHAAS